jgi:hypothetical protein
MLGRDFMSFWSSRRGGPWNLPAGRIAEFNRFVRGSIDIVARRDGVGENVRAVKLQVLLAAA